MAEWVLLVLAVPAIVVTVVLLAGFAGCDDVFGLHRPPAPMIQAAVGTSSTSIALEWTHAEMVPGFEIEVTRLPDDEVLDLIEATSSPFEVTGLVEATTYSSRVRAVYSDGDTGAFSNPVNGATFTVTFDTANDVGAPVDQPGAQGFTLVQRLDQIRLDASGVRVAIVLRGPAAGTASLDRVYISQPAAAGDPYDAAADLTRVFDVNVPPGTPPLQLQANTDVRLPVVDYVLDQAQPLLIAFDITAATPSTVRFIPVPTGVAEAFFRQGAEAALANRTSGYTAEDRIYLVTKIEVDVG